MMSLKTFLSPLLIFLFMPGLWAGDAEDLLQKCRVANGIICVPDCGEGSIALSLAEKSRFIVLALDESDENVAKAKLKAIDSGLYGRRLYVQKGSLMALPWAENYIDLLVLNGRKNLDLSAKERREILRVLTPIHGRAVLADATIDKSELPGSDWWSHKLHGPNNNPVSKDTAFSFPPLLQYRAMPMFNPGFGSALTMDGVHFDVMDQVIKTPMHLGLTGRMYARNLYNGRILWEARWPEHTLPLTPTQVLDSGVIYLAGGEGARVLRRELLSGKELTAIELGGTDQRIKWMAIENSTLYALLGDPFEMNRPYSPYQRPNMKEWSGKQTFGKEIIAWDLTSGKKRWTHRAASPIDNVNVAVAEGNLYFYCDGKHVTCLSGDDGKEIWTFKDQEVFNKLTRPERPKSHFLAKTSLMMVADGILRFTVAEGEENFLLNSIDGQLIGNTRSKFSEKKMVIMNGNLYGGHGIDGKTGKALADKLPSPAGTAWCGQATYAPGTGLLGHSTLTYKSPCSTGAWVAGGMLIYSPTVCTCGSTRGAGTFTSGENIFDNIELYPEHPLIQGPAFAGLAKDENTEANEWSAYRGGSGHRGSTLVTVSEKVQTAWTVTPEHPFSFAPQQNLYQMEFDERPVPPITVGRKVFSAGSNGLITAQDLEDGHHLWTFAADGPVLTSPAFSEGRLFIPCGDGWLYALDAASGQLAWKLRLAPMARRILLFDQMMSNWPVLSLAVEDGVIYASAGHMVNDGGKTFSISARDGKMLWSRFHPVPKKSFQGSHNVPDIYAQGFGGQTTLVGERVWMAGYSSAPLSLDRKDGSDHHDAMKPKIMNRQSWMGFKSMYYTFGGQDVIALDRGHVLIGGAHLLENQNIQFSKFRVNSYNLIKTNAQGDWNLDIPPIEAITFAKVAPACNEDFFVFAGPPSIVGQKGEKRVLRSLDQGGLSLCLWRKRDFIAAVDGMVKKNPVSEVKKWGQTFLNFDRSVFGPFPYERAQWQKPALDIRALALCKNAIIVAHAESFSKTDNNWGKYNEPDKGLLTYSGWKVSAFDLDQGEELWSLSLPSEPLLNGLAIAYDSSILVALRDGSTVCLK